MIGFFVMSKKEKKLKDLTKEELKERAEYTERMLEIINNTEIKWRTERDKPKTELGVSNKAKKLIEEYTKKAKK